MQGSICRQKYKVPFLNGNWEQVSITSGAGGRIEHCVSNNSL